MEWLLQAIRNVLTDGTQKTQIDGTPTVTVSGVSTAANQTTQTSLLTSIDNSLYNDLTGNLKVSQKTSYDDIKHLYDKLPLLFDEIISGTATSTFSSASKSIVLTAPANNDYVIRQTFQRYNYQAGKPLVYEFTVNNFATETNTQKYIGPYNTSTAAPYTATIDGIRLASVSGSGISVQVYKSGSLIEEFPAASFNTPTVAIDWTKPQILRISYLWFGYFGYKLEIVNNGAWFTLATRTFNNSSIPSTYMTTPNQPLRYEMRGTGANAGTFQFTCANIGIDGASNNIGLTFVHDSGNSDIALALANTRYAPMGMRLDSTKLMQSFVEPIDISILSTSNDNYRWELVLNPTFAAAPTYSSVTNSAVETYTNAAAPTTITGGYVLASGYALKSQAINVNPEILRKLGVSINGTADQLVLAITPLSAAMTCFASITRKEKI